MPRKNRTEYRKYMREYMRKKRQKGLTEKAHKTIQLESMSVNPNVNPKTSWFVRRVYKML